jgi:hypothetical protein
MGAWINRHLHRIDAFVRLGGVFALGYYSLRLVELAFRGLGVIVAITLLMAQGVWILYLAPLSAHQSNP